MSQFCDWELNIVSPQRVEKKIKLFQISGSRFQVPDFSPNKGGSLLFLEEKNT